MPTRPYDPKTSTAVPIEFAGKWIAWDSEHKTIVATAENLPALWQLVQDKRIEDPVFEKVPKAHVRFVGMR